MLSIASQIASELKVREAQVQSAIDLIDGGATVPFIARYRKEATGGLDDVQLRELEARLAYLRELHERRAAVLKSIDEQGKLTPALRAAIDAAPTKQELEDLYLPYKPRRRTKGQIAKEWGIEPLADRLWIDPTLDPQAEAQAFVKPEKGEGGEDFTTTTAVLDGVRDILSERWAEDAALVQACANGCGPRACCKASWRRARTRAIPRSPSSATTSTTTSPSAACPATARWRCSAAASWRFWMPSWCCPRQNLRRQPTAATPAWPKAHRPAPGLVAPGPAGRRAAAQVRRWTWRVKLSLSTERDLFARLREEAEKVAIKVFGDNLRDLLLAAPAGRRW
jgi:uncharacterized protein